MSPSHSLGSPLRPSLRYIISSASTVRYRRARPLTNWLATRVSSHSTHANLFSQLAAHAHTPPAPRSGDTANSMVGSLVHVSRHAFQPPLLLGPLAPVACADAQPMHTPRGYVQPRRLRARRRTGRLQRWQATSPRSISRAPDLSKVPDHSRPPSRCPLRNRTDKSLYGEEYSMEACMLVQRLQTQLEVSRTARNCNPATLQASGRPPAAIARRDGLFSYMGRVDSSARRPSPSTLVFRV